MQSRTIRALSTALLACAAILLTSLTATAAPRDSQVTVTAHRGASGYAPENTLAAGQAAADLDITWVEIDVQRSKDGELIIMHDTTLSRTTDAEDVFPDRAPWRVGDFTLAEMQKLDAGSWFDDSFAGEPVPTLQQYLDLLDGNDQKLLLEVKAPELYPGIEEEIADELDAEGWLSPGQVAQRLVIQSFSADSMRATHALLPQVTIGYLGNPAVEDMPAIARFADQINPNHRLLTKEYVDAVHALTGPHGIPLTMHTYTINDAETAVRIARLGVDGIITNFPDVIRDAVRPLRG